MRDYYAARLSGERLRRCYEIATPRVRRYFEEEIRFVLDRLEPDDTVLELGCGYGRVALRLADVAGRVVGIDTSPESLVLARRLAGPRSRCEFLQMDGLEMTFADFEFDKVVCVQNGICSFGVDREMLVREALRVTRPGGPLFFSTYSERFWPERLHWFEAQAAAGLVGPIDHDKSGNGTIACKDGFRSGTMTPNAFRLLGQRLGLAVEVTEVDESSVFCEIVAPP
jgi:2-polyprenyl-6-hydroxyphenyl methylase/3-demethylubiquinone-9 3-methyltransferase